MNKCELTLSINYHDIPVNIIPVTENGMALFNREVESVRASGAKELTRSRSGGFKYGIKYFKPPMYDVRALGSCVELTVVAMEGCYRVQFRQDFTKTEKDIYSGSTSFKIFRNELKKDGIYIETYAIMDGEAVKATIPAPKISLECAPGVYEHVHHIDIHSAYMGAIAEAFPTLRKTIERIYSQRKYNPKMKAVLTHTFGYMQSKMIRYKYAHISKEAIVGTIAKLEKLGAELQRTGRRILAYNTDGIWYVGNVYHGDGEGAELGQWVNDHENCRVKFVSIGTYGYEENGKFKPVVRARRALDKVKPREEWTMDDLDNLGAEEVYALNTATNRIEKMEDIETWQETQAD